MSEKCFDCEGMYAGGVELCQLHAHAEELREALENIKKHQEYMAPLVYKLTGAWMIAESALAKIKAGQQAS